MVGNVDCVVCVSEGSAGVLMGVWMVENLGCSGSKGGDVAIDIHESFV